jgi:phosphohistidine phosphatase
MKTIFIIRHAKTESPSFNQEDWARQLLPSGIREAENISNAMKAKGKTRNFILSSDAKRTRKTAEIFQKTLELPSEKISFHHELYNGSGLGVVGAFQHNT